MHGIRGRTLPERLRDSSDLARVTQGEGEHWSVRKALRRMIWHEQMHRKSIVRILAAYAQSLKGA
jgi:hypothetical protein